MSESLRATFSSVLSDLMLATHCHSCGVAATVCLTGYAGVHCSKRCWKFNEYYPKVEYEIALENGTEPEGDDFACPFGGCKHCIEGSNVSRAASAWHRHDSVVWPMAPHKPCANACIKERRPVWKY